MAIPFSAAPAPTPRTDAEEVYYSEIVTGRDAGLYWVRSDFARQLERENADLLHDLERAMANHNADINSSAGPGDGDKRGDFWKRCWEARMVPPGWKLVPEVPTEAMLDALGNSPWIVESDTKTVGNEVITTRREYRDQRYVVDGWQDMLAAAPELPSPMPHRSL